MTAWRGALCIALALLMRGLLPASAAPCPPVPAAALSVASDDGVDRLSVTASRASLRALISAAACLAGFQLTGVVPADRRVSVEFSRRPLDRALRQLLAGESVIFVYDQPTAGRSAKLRRVILLGPSNPQQGSVGAPPAVSPADEPGVVPAAEEPFRGASGDTETFDPDWPLEQLLPLTDHPDARMRKAALEALTGHEDDERARQALMERLRDPDAYIRLTVIGLLGPYVTQWPGAEDVLLTALRDPAANVRHLALQTLWEVSSPAVSEVLQRALHDEAPEIRARAEELLRETLMRESGNPGAGVRTVP